jgi:hypothetical protein
LTTKQKGMLLGETSRKDTSLGHLLILKACLHVKQLHLEPLAKKKNKRGKAKGDAKFFEAIKRQ